MKKLLCLLLFICSTPAEQSGTGERPSAPEQPMEGPGGRNYAYENIQRTKYGRGEKQYWIYEPKNAKKALPVIVFLHGWSAMSPKTYERWLEHLAQKGNIVIYPRWQKSLATPPGTITDNAINATRRALRKLNGSDHAKADLQKFAVAGTSMGGIIAANIAALAKERKLPKVKALLIAQPGNTWKSPKGIYTGARIQLANLSHIPPDTLTLVLTNKEDSVAGSMDAKTIFRGLSHIPAKNKNYIIIRSDRHGRPKLISSHGIASSPKVRSKKKSRAYATNALDYYAHWKLFDALTDAAFYNKNRDSALGDTEAQRYMGTWSDGKPVKPLKVMNESDFK